VVSVVSEPSLDSFKALSQNTAIPYQTLIDLHLWACAATHKQLRLAWAVPKGPTSA